MARATLLEVAKKVADSIKSGAIQPGEQYTLHAFAKLAGCYQSAVMKVLEMWQLSRASYCHISIDKLTTAVGKRPHYAIKVEKKIGNSPEFNPQAIQSPPEKMVKIKTQLRQRSAGFSPEILTTLIHQLRELKQRPLEFLERLKIPMMESWLQDKKKWRQYVPFITTAHVIAQALSWVGVTRLSKITDIGTEGDSLFFALLVKEWEGYNGECEYEMIYRDRLALLWEISASAKWDCNPLQSPPRFYPRYFEPQVCRNKDFDLVLIRNTIHHGEFEKWKLIRDALKQKVTTGILILDKLAIKGMPYVEDDDGGNLWSIPRWREFFHGMNDYSIVPRYSRDNDVYERQAMDIRALFTGTMTEDEFAENWRQLNAPTLVQIFIKNNINPVHGV